MISKLLADDEASITTESRESDGQAAGGADGGPIPGDGQTIGGPDPHAGPDLDDVFDLLRNRRRRDILTYLRTASGPVDLGTLAVRIAAKECDKDPDGVTSTERKRVYISLYQSHLPKMEDLGAVEYDKRGGTVEPGEDYVTFLGHLLAEPAVIETDSDP